MATAVRSDRVSYTSAYQRRITGVGRDSRLAEGLRSLLPHPIVQGDNELTTAFQPNSVLYQYAIDLYVLALAMEYRWVWAGQ